MPTFYMLRKINFDWYNILNMDCKNHYRSFHCYYYRYSMCFHLLFAYCGSSYCHFDLNHKFEMWCRNYWLFGSKMSQYGSYTHPHGLYCHILRLSRSCQCCYLYRFDKILYLNRLLYCCSLSYSHKHALLIWKL